MGWLVKYGVWLILALVVLVWEVVAVKSFRKALGLGPRNHPTLSELVWMFERKFGRKGQVVVLVAMLDLTLHFLFGLPLLPIPV